MPVPVEKLCVLSLKIQAIQRFNHDSLEITFLYTTSWKMFFIIRKILFKFKYMNCILIPFSNSNVGLL